MKRRTYPPELRRAAEVAARRAFPDADAVTVTFYAGVPIVEVWDDGEARIYRYTGGKHEELR